MEARGLDTHENAFLRGSFFRDDEDDKKLLAMLCSHCSIFIESLEV